MLPFPSLLKESARKEAYEFIDKQYKKLPRNSDGSFDERSGGFNDNDVDALRHAYVSGIFTQTYGEKAADIFGRMNEYSPGAGASSYGDSKSTNMDLWNNSVGRKYGKKTKTGKELFDKLLKALKKGELIIGLDDPRKYDGAPAAIQSRRKNSVIVLKESKTGENLVFFDLDTRTVLTKPEFLSLISSGKYPNYEIRNINGKETPVSKKDGLDFNNLC
ncbi:MAG: hypothetical protein V1647_03940 [Pseudomonadota bacterium]